VNGTHRTILACLAFLLAFAGYPCVPSAWAGDAAKAAPAPKTEAPKTEATKQGPVEAAAPRIPMLWEVDTKPKIYLFGTIHLGDPRVLAHPPVVQRALDESQALYVEVEMNMQTMMSLVPLMRLPPGQSLKTLLPPKLHERMQALFKTKGLPQAVLDGMDGLHIWAIVLQLQTLDIDPKTAGQALDKVLYDAAKKAGKHVGALEVPKEQIDIFATLSQKEQIKLLEDSVTDVEKARKAKVKPMEALIDLYLQGDAEHLLSQMTKDMDKGDDLSKKLMKRMLDDRNVRMVRRLLTKVQAHPDKTTFLAVGTAHYPGPAGIIALLRKTGFRVRKLNAVADMKKRWPPLVPAAAPASSSRKAPGRARIRVGPFCLPAPCASGK